MLIQTIMLITLGFLGACLIVLLLIPAFWRRAVRLNTKRIKASMPFSEAEIQADKDQLRADYAIQIRQFEVSLEKANRTAARHLVDISRRDARVKALETEIKTLNKELTTLENANRVYEENIAKRIPKMEAQLQKAKELLGARYQEITQLRTKITRQEDKLGEARTIDQVRRAEVEKLRLVVGNDPTSLAELGRDRVPLMQYEELEVKNREQKAEIGRLRRTLEAERRQSHQHMASHKSSLHALFEPKEAQKTADEQASGEKTDNDKKSAQTSAASDQRPKRKIRVGRLSELVKPSTANISAQAKAKTKANDNSANVQDAANIKQVPDSADKTNGAASEVIEKTTDEDGKRIPLADRIKKLQER